MITKAIIPLAGLGTRHLPLSKILPKELLPLADKPLLHYAMQEAKDSGVKEIIFIVSGQKKIVSDYFKKTPHLEKLLEEKKQDELLEALESIEKLTAGMSFTYVTDKPAGDGHAILQARKLIGDEPCFVMYPDDVMEARTPCLEQLGQVFRTAEKPVIGLFEVSQEKLSWYGIVAAEKIANRLYKIKQIVEKPKKGQAPSRMAIAGRSIITPEVVDRLKKMKPDKQGELKLTDAFGQMVKDGTIVYGYQCEGKWLECGTRSEWIKSFVYIAAKHPQYGKEVKKFIKEEKLA